MDRRTFLSGAAGVGASVALAACGENDSQNQQQTGGAGTPERPGQTPGVGRRLREWNLVTTWPKNFPGLGTGAQRLADHITAASEGRLAVKLYAAGEFVPAFESFDAVREGKAHIFHAAPNCRTNKMLLKLGFDHCVPIESRTIADNSTEVASAYDALDLGSITRP